MSRELIEQTHEDRRAFGRRQFLRDVAIAGAGLAGLSLLSEEAAAAVPGWGDWQNLGIPPGDASITSPALGRNLDGRLELFLVGYDASDVVADYSPVWHLWQTAPNGPWSGWAKFSSPPGTSGFVDPPAVGRNQDGRLEVFAQQAVHGPVWHLGQTAPNDGWSSWASLGGAVSSQPVVGVNQDGRLELFVTGTDSAVWHAWQGAPNAPFSGWASFGGKFQAEPVVGYNLDGRMELFALGADNLLYHLWQVAPSDGWSDWLPFPRQLKAPPAVYQNADGRMEVIAWAADTTLLHMWQGIPNAPFSAWDSFGGPSNSNPAIGRNADGRLEVFACGMDNALWHRWQVAPNDGWSGWASLGGPAGGLLTGERLVAAQHQDGRLIILARDASGDLCHLSQA